MNLNLNKQQRFALLQLLTDYAETVDAVAKLRGHRFRASITVESDDGKEFVAVEFEKQLALKGLETQKSYIEGRLRDFGIEVDIAR
jgi:hypothetical protein